MYNLHIMGDIRTQHIAIPDAYNFFVGRDTWLDCRTPGMITIDKDANFGWNTVLVVQSHDVRPGCFGNVVARPITVRSKAFIAGFAMLYNCLIEEGAVVALGCVVRGVIVPAWTMVEGNPARIIKKYDPQAGRWVEAEGHLEPLWGMKDKGTVA